MVWKRTGSVAGEPVDLRRRVVREVAGSEDERLRLKFDLIFSGTVMYEESGGLTTGSGVNGFYLNQPWPPETERR